MFVNEVAEYTREVRVFYYHNRKLSVPKKLFTLFYILKKHPESTTAPYLRAA